MVRVNAVMALDLMSIASGPFSVVWEHESSFPEIRITYFYCSQNELWIGESPDSRIYSQLQPDGSTVYFRIGEAAHGDCAAGWSIRASNLRINLIGAIGLAMMFAAGLAFSLAALGGSGSLMLFSLIAGPIGLAAFVWADRN